MKVRMAMSKDLPKIEDLLSQVDLVHHNGRPDLFKIGTKYTRAELEAILLDSARPVLVAVDENDAVQGYAFCVYKQFVNDNIMTDVKTLYIDDLCVDEKRRGAHIGKTLYEAALRMARDNGCYNLTLNVWSCNPSAIKFYESCGMLPQKIGMEVIL